MSSENKESITYLSIEKGNPSDTNLFIAMLDFHQPKLARLPGSVVTDGGYASQANMTKGRGLGVKRVAFHKPVDISLQAMGVRSKTFDQLRHFRAGVEGYISELKRPLVQQRQNRKSSMASRPMSGLQFSAIT